MLTSSSTWMSAIIEILSCCNNNNWKIISFTQFHLWLQFELFFKPFITIQQCTNGVFSTRIKDFLQSIEGRANYLQVTICPGGRRCWINWYYRDKWEWRRRRGGEKRTSIEVGIEIERKYPIFDLFPYFAVLFSLTSPMFFSFHTWWAKREVSASALELIRLLNWMRTK